MFHSARKRNRGSVVLEREIEVKKLVVELEGSIKNSPLGPVAHGSKKAEEGTPLSIISSAVVGTLISFSARLPYYLNDSGGDDADRCCD